MCAFWEDKEKKMYTKTKRCSGVADQILVSSQKGLN